MSLPREKWDTWDPTLISEVKGNLHRSSSLQSTLRACLLQPTSSPRWSSSTSSLSTLTSAPSRWGPLTVSTFCNLVFRFPSAGWSSIFVNFVFCIFWCSSHSHVVRRLGPASLIILPSHWSPSRVSGPNIILIYIDLPLPNIQTYQMMFSKYFPSESLMK